MYLALIPEQTPALGGGDRRWPAQSPPRISFASRSVASALVVRSEPVVIG